ncbi:glutaredoxin-1-like [Falco biarmicus]|uniref:glutaredoxin-1 n=1 Tax=Falco cherrug TaxID=345164 RepID=UPI000392E4E2|nr:glutaredoxin-1 [Falco cherrug]XP_055647455.1 glutaredoxin-1-like [Falco peregrinus]XP_055647462.1 glutaredoxin-1-like [Falco peregrinus]XP_056181435.1 glutaredoxin-1-like [Falco biarmicus]XP_056181452.1 glutaredoxin-1-like [Falco biarmicus]
MDRFVNSKLKDNSVTLFTKAGCPYCRNAIEMLKKYNIAPGGLQEFDITGLTDVQDYLQKITGQRNGPHVFLGRHCLGGLSDLQNMECQLPTALQQMGILM